VLPFFPLISDSDLPFLETEKAVGDGGGFQAFMEGQQKSSFSPNLTVLTNH